MPLVTMYPGIPFSPAAQLTQALSPTEQTIYVSDSTVFPEPPNYATIGIDEDAETILYNGRAMGELNGCVRGIEGVANSWVMGEPIGRNFSNKDYAALTHNISQLDSSKPNKAIVEEGFEGSFALVNALGQYTTSVKKPADFTALEASISTHVKNKDNPHGSTPAQIGAAPSFHNHDASNIASGILPVSRGGTGQSDLANVTVGKASSCTGNSATATKFQTARNINGVAFDGSKDIAITAAANGGNADTVDGLHAGVFALQTNVDERLTKVMEKAGAYNRTGTLNDATVINHWYSISSADGVGGLPSIVGVNYNNSALYVYGERSDAFTQMLFCGNNTHIYTRRFTQWQSPQWSNWVAFATTKSYPVTLINGWRGYVDCNVVGKVVTLSGSIYAPVNVSTDGLMCNLPIDCGYNGSFTGANPGGESYMFNLITNGLWFAGGVKPLSANKTVSFSISTAFLHEN